MSSIYQFIKFFIGWPLSVVALFFVARLFKNSYPSVLSHLSSINYWLLALGLFFFVLYYFLRAYIWQQLLKNHGHLLEYRKSTYLWAISELRRYIPGNIWSFLGRATLFGKEKIPQKTIFILLFLEAQLIIVSCFVVSIFSTPVLLHAGNIQVNYALVSWIYLLLLVAIILIFVFGEKLFRNTQILNKLFVAKMPFENWRLLILYCIAFFFYGLGNYFVINSVIFLTPKYFFEFIGLFSAGLIAGYLSFITPTGLGVREAVITAGLSVFMSLPIAAFASLFSRLLLIISEIIFIALSYVLYVIKNKAIANLEYFFGKHKHEITLLFFIFAFILYFSVASIFRYNNFYTGRFDLGNMDQAVWNTAHGRIFQVTDANGTGIISRLAFHADFILILLAPLYYFWSDPRMLLLIQAAVAGVGAIFVYLIAKDKFKNKNYSLLFAFLYILNPALQYATLYDFHAVTLGATFLLGAFYFMNKKRYGFFLLMLFLACITKEEVWIIAGLFGLYIAAGQKKIFFGSVLAVISFAMFYFLVSYAIPHAKGGEHFALSYYSDFGSTPSGIIKNIFFEPTKTIPILFQYSQREYIYQLFFPVGFFSIFSLVPLIFAAPDLVIDLLSNNANNHQIYYQYSAPINPFIFISAIFGFAYIIKKFPRAKTLLTIYLLFASFYSAYNFGPLPEAKHANTEMFTKPQPDAAKIDQFLSRIRKKYSIAASNNVGSHLSHRQKIYTIPVGLYQADYVVFLLNDPGAQPSPQAQKVMMKNLEKDKRYVEVYHDGDFVVFKSKQV